MECAVRTTDYVSLLRNRLSYLNCVCTLTENVLSSKFVTIDWIRMPLMTMKAKPVAKTTF